MAQCGFCHQQGSAFLRRERSAEEWATTIHRMVRYGARLSTEAQKEMPALLEAHWRDINAHPEVVLNARDLFALDTTGLEGLEQILKAVGQRGGVLCVQDAQEQPRSLMERSGFNARLAAQNAVQHRKSS